MKSSSIFSMFSLITLALSAPIELSNTEVEINYTPILTSLQEVTSFLSPGALPIEQATTKRDQLTKRAIVVDIYADSNFNGRHEGLVSDLGRCYNLGNGWNDAISSLRVPGGVTCLFFYDGGCPSSGSGIGFPPGSYATIPSEANDRFSSYRC